jgi:hypothetical protein
MIGGVIALQWLGCGGGKADRLVGEWGIESHPVPARLLPMYQFDKDGTLRLLYKPVGSWKLLETKGNEMVIEMSNFGLTTHREKLVFEDDDHFTMSSADKGEQAPVVRYKRMKSARAEQ